MSQNVLERLIANLIESKLISITAFYLEIFFILSFPRLFAPLLNFPKITSILTQEREKEKNTLNDGHNNMQHPQHHANFTQSFVV